MKILVVGRRKFQQRTMTGTIGVLEGLVEHLQDSGATVHVYPSKAQNKVLTYAKLIFVALRRWDIINVHLHPNYGVIVGLLRPRSRKTVLTVHGYSRLESPTKKYLGLIQRLQVKCLFKNLIFPSKLILDRVKNLEHISDGWVIYNGLDKKQLSMADPLVGTNKDIDIFSLCGYGVNKGITFLLDTLTLRKHDWRCVVAGNFMDGFDRQLLRKYQRPNIDLRGSLDPIIAWSMYGRSKIYVQPSSFESFSIPVLEAMCCGLSVVVTDGTGISEILTDGFDCLKVRYGDVKALHAILGRLLQDQALQKKLSGNARQTALRFTNRRMAEEYLTAFKQMELGLG